MLVRLDPSSRTVTAKLSFGRTLAEGALAPDGMIWMPDKEQNVVYRVDPEKAVVVDSFAAGAGAFFALPRLRLDVGHELRGQRRLALQAERALDGRAVEYGGRRRRPGRSDGAYRAQDRPARRHRPRDHPRRLRCLGARGRGLRVGVGRAGRRGLDRGHPPRARGRRQLDRHGRSLRVRPLGGGRRARARRSRGGRAPVRVHEGRAARRAGSNDDSVPRARLAQARARGEPLAPSRGRRRPLPDPLADSRRGDRGGLVDPRRAQRAGACPAHRRVELRGRAAAANPVDRAGRDSSTAVLAPRSWSRGGDPPVRRAGEDRCDRLLPDGVRAAHGRDDARADREPARGRLAQAQRALPRATSSRATWSWSSG